MLYLYDVSTTCAYKTTKGAERNRYLAMQKHRNCKTRFAIISDPILV